MLCNASTTCYVEFMKNEKKTQHIQNYDMDTMIENQNNNKQWTHMLNDLQRNKLNTSMLEFQNPYCLKKNICI
jgi:hypothetical protein